MGRKALPNYIPLAEALIIEGSQNAQAFSRWVKRWNLNPNTSNKVMRRKGKVELNSLKAALNEDAQRYEAKVRIQEHVAPSANKPALEGEKQKCLDRLLKNHFAGHRS